ncbi:MAG: hypothetical protein Ct9H300mP23_09480 [Nitrospinota bacterium]|nr:MAG: hypothetical protein Ct9H300mP23_09480 [Nitrospinota bacterium]
MRFFVPFCLHIMVTSPCFRTFSTLSRICGCLGKSSSKGRFAMASLGLWNISSMAKLLCRIERDGETKINPSMREKKIFWLIRPVLS